MSQYLPTTLLSFLTLLLLTSCEKEIDIDYPSSAPLTTIEGQVTNEGMDVVITHTRPVGEATPSAGLPDAHVTISWGDQTQTLAYNPTTGHYHSDTAGQPGNTYHLSVDFEGTHYESQSTMPLLSTILSTTFVWQDVLSERLLAFEVWASDPEPETRNYYWYRMDRRSSHPHGKAKQTGEAYRWNVFDDRGNPPGRIYRDIICMTEKMAEEDEEEQWERILYDGDTIKFQLMVIDKPVYDFFRTLVVGQNGRANPVGNISGGCLGYFSAAHISRAKDVIYHAPQK